MPGDQIAKWWTDQPAPEKDCYVAFRGALGLDGQVEVEIRLLGASTFLVWLDGRWLAEGPARFAPDYPEYLSVKAALAGGMHVLAAEVHHAGVQTHCRPDMSPFFSCEVIAGGREIPVEWKCRRLEAYLSQVRRINSCSGWMTWQDTRKDPADWRRADFDDSDWPAPCEAKARIGPLRPPTIAPLRRTALSLAPIAGGKLAEMLASTKDDPPTGFFTRDLDCRDLPPQGLWRRYDLGQVRLGRPRFILDLPRGAVVEFGHSERLFGGRVAPYLGLSGLSCNMDHFIARGGVQEFFPHDPRGGRFLEVHVLAKAEEVRFVEEWFDERCYHGRPEGGFECDDQLLNQVWYAGLRTYRACAEDAIVDCPTRERGQWTGDANVGMHTASVAYGDLALARRCLAQAAQSAREDGLVNGMSPGVPCFIPSYAMRWVSACLEYFRLTGDRLLLEEMFPYARRNLAAMERKVGEAGLGDMADWNFIDWGYVRPEAPIDIPANLFYLEALRAMAGWCRILNHPEDLPNLTRLESHILGVFRAWLDEHAGDGEEGWRRIGYHAVALALRAGLVEGRREADCIEFIKARTLECFPNNPSAPRLSDPSVKCRQLITPYFAHFVFPPLIERGQMDFVLDQYRACWGWAIGQGRTTLLEVFDTRWSHCHQWSSCPTWQLSRYVLGLHNRFDLGADHFELKLVPGSLSWAKGAIPLPRPFRPDDTDKPPGLIEIFWRREGQGISYRLQAPRPIWLHLPPASTGGKEQLAEVRDHWEMLIP